MEPRFTVDAASGRLTVTTKGGAPRTGAVIKCRMLMAFRLEECTAIGADGSKTWSAPLTGMTKI